MKEGRFFGLIPRLEKKNAYSVRSQEEKNKNSATRSKICLTCHCHSSKVWTNKKKRCHKYCLFRTKVSNGADIGHYSYSSTREQIYDGNTTKIYTKRTFTFGSTWSWSTLRYILKYRRPTCLI